MIEWKPYKHEETHLPIGNYLMSDGEYVCRADVDYYSSDDEFIVFLEERTRIDGPEAVTHFAVINLPKQFEETKMRGSQNFYHTKEEMERVIWALEYKWNEYGATEIEMALIHRLKEYAQTE